MIYYLDIWRKRYTTWEFEEKKLPGYLKERIYTWTYEGKDIYLDIWRKDILPGNLQERIYTWTYEGKEIPAYLKERIYFLDFWRKGYIYYLDIWRKGSLFPIISLLSNDLAANEKVILLCSPDSSRASILKKNIL